MSAAKEYSGFFSLVRFVPDEFRGEGVNLGVVLLCPELLRLDWHFTTNHRRALRFFRKEHEVDLARLKAMKASLQERLEAKRGSLLTRDGLENFAKLFRNQLQLTDLRSCVVSDFDQDLLRFYARLVKAEATPAPEEEREVIREQTLRRKFAGRLRERRLYDRLQHEVQISARYKPTPYEFAHAYENGKFQIIHEVSFARSNPDDNCQRAMALAMEIEDVTEQRPRHSTAFRLVAAFASDQTEAETAIRRLFGDKEVGLYVPAQIDALVDEIERDLG